METSRIWERRLPVCTRSHPLSRSLSTLQAIILGGVVLAGLGLGVAGLVAVGSRHWPWNEHFYARTRFPKIAGVDTGPRVRGQGVEGGEVGSGEFPGHTRGKAVVSMRVARKRA